MKLRERMKEKANLSSTYLYIALILLLGLFINLINISIKKGITHDEASTLLFASGNWSFYYDMVNRKLPPLLTKVQTAEWKQYMQYNGGNKLGTIWKDSSVDVHPPLFLILLNLGFLIFGNSLIVAKSINIFIYVISAIVFFFLARKLFDHNLAVIALLLYCIAPASLAVSCEIRAYAVLGLFNIIAILAVVRIVHEANDKKWWFIWIFAGLASLYTHYIYAMLFLSVNIYILIYCVRKINRSYLIKYLSINCLAVILLIPLILLFWQQRSVAYDMGWSGGWMENKNFSAAMIWIFFETVLGFMRRIFSFPVWINLALGLTIYSLIFYFLTKLKYKKDFWLFSIMLFVTTIFHVVLYQFGAIPSHAIGAKYQVLAVPTILIAITSMITEFKKRSMRIGFVILLVTLMSSGSAYNIWKNYKARDHKISTYSMNKFISNDDLIILDATFSGLVGSVIFALPEEQRILVGSQKDLSSKIDLKNAVIDEKSVIYISASKYNKFELQNEIANRLLKAFGLRSTSHLEPLVRLGCRGCGKGYNIFYFRRDV